MKAGNYSKPGASIGLSPITRQATAAAGISGCLAWFGKLFGRTQLDVGQNFPQLWIGEILRPAANLGQKLFQRMAVYLSGQ